MKSKVKIQLKINGTIVNLLEKLPRVANALNVGAFSKQMESRITFIFKFHKEPSDYLIEAEEDLWTYVNIEINKKGFGNSKDLYRINKIEILINSVKVAEPGMVLGKFVFTETKKIAEAVDEDSKIQRKNGLPVVSLRKARADMIAEVFETELVKVVKQKQNYDEKQNN